jgi:hypothetical protein
MAGAVRERRASFWLTSGVRCGAEAGLPSRGRSHGRRLQVGDDVQRSDDIPVPSSFSGIASNRAMGGLVHAMSGGSRLQAWQNKQLVIVCRSEICRGWSGRVSVLVDQAAEDASLE